MFISNYFYEAGKFYQDYYRVLEDRAEYHTVQYITRWENKLKELDLDGKVAVLYVGGISTSNGEDRVYQGKFTCSQDKQVDRVLIKDLQAYMMHKFIGVMPCRDNVDYANINSNTCASSLYAVYEAEGLLGKGFDHVVVIAEEKTSFNTIRIFAEHRIDVTVGEGFACVVFSKEGSVEVKDSKWAYKWTSNPFNVVAGGYAKVKSDADVVKGHKTGTEQNDAAELDVFGATIGYKDKIGHCQGASGLIELCMVLDDDTVSGNVLCVASGLGGFYGSCVVVK